MAEIRDLNEQVNRLWKLRLEGSGDPPSGGGNMETRVAKLEAHVEHIQRDVSEIKGDLRELIKKIDLHFYMNWGGLIALGTGLAYLLAKGFKWF